MTSYVSVVPVDPAVAAEAARIRQGSSNTPSRYASLMSNSGGRTSSSVSDTPSGKVESAVSNTSSSTNRTVSDVSNTSHMTPEALAALNMLIQELMSGGTNEQIAERIKRQQTQDLVNALLSQYSKGAAFGDAKGLMALNLQKAMEENMPSIQRAIEGAGTSASSMQGLLSQKLARDSALAASALGAEQAARYGQIASSLSSTLEALTRQNSPVTDAILKALDIAKGSVTNSSRITNDSSTSSATTNTKTTMDYTYPDSTATRNGSNSITDSSSSGTQLDPNVYYSRLGRSGDGRSLYDFLMSNN